MGLFKKSKKSKKENLDIPNFPKYETQIHNKPLDLHKMDESEFEDFDIPVRKPKLKPARIPQPMEHHRSHRNHISAPSQVSPLVDIRPHHKNKMPVPIRHQIFEEANTDLTHTDLTGTGLTRTDTNQPIYVRLEEYNKAVSTIKQILDKTVEAEEILSEIESIKSKEDKQLIMWQKEINDVKNKILGIEKSLFESK